MATVKQKESLVFIRLLKEIRRKMQAKKVGVEVHFFDTTLRDGAQSLPADHQFKDGDKVNIANAVAQMGILVIEAGFPATPHDSDEVYAVSTNVGQNTFKVSEWDDGKEVNEKEYYPIIAGLSRANQADIDKTWKAVSPAHSPRIHTFVATDNIHMKAKFPDKTPEQVLEMAVTAVKYAKDITSKHNNASVEFSAEAASTSDTTYLERIVKETINQGADIINLPDTVGHRDPFWMYDFYTTAIGWIISSNPDVIISAHNHNDLGMAAANTFALVKAAADYSKKHNRLVKVQLETSICGLGERAGNADIFPVSAHLWKFSDDLPVPVKWQLNPQVFVDTATRVMGDAGFGVDRQGPIVGADINVHRSGIHSDGVVKGGHKLYTPHDPVFWGHLDNARHEDGKYQGRAGKMAA